MSIRPRVIGLCGPAQCGKDEARKALEGEGYKGLAFADGVREVALRLNPVLRYFPAKDPALPALLRRDWSTYRYADLLEEVGYEEAKRYSAFRAYLVDIGAGLRETLGEDIWVDRLKSRVRAERWDSEDGIVYHVISDVRYVNEAAAIKRLGGEVWRIHRPGVGPANEEEARSLKEIDDGWWPDVVMHNTFISPEEWRQEVLRNLRLLD